METFKEVILLNEIISVINLKKVFEKQNAIDNINFSVQKGEIFGLLGPSGAGKTTLIKILTGELEKTMGEVQVLNYPSKKFHDRNFKAQIGVLSDNSALYERLSIYDNLKLYCKIFKVPINEVENILKKVNLYKDRKKRVSKLSKGMKQRVLLARTLLHRPKLLFLDEPTSNLDPRNTNQIHEVLRELNEDGTTIFISTHDMEEATSLCNRVILLEKGRIKELNSPEVLRYKYSSNNIIVETIEEKIIVIENIPENAEKFRDLIEGKRVKRINTDYPTLGEVFLKVTGRELS